MHDLAIRHEETRLLNIDAAKQLLADALNIQDVTEIRDYAEAVRLVARQAKAGLEAQNQAAEIKLWAERRGGEMLASIERQRGEQTSSIARTNYQSAVERADIGRTTAHNWQRIASIPQSDFEQHIETAKAEREELTTAGTVRLAKQFDYKRDTKSNHAGNVYEPQGYDACQTPPYAIDPLLPYLNSNHTIWEPAAGEQHLVEAFYDAGFDRVLVSDMLTGQNFLEYEPDERWDCLITNPPYSIKYEFLARCYELGKPFALLVPVEFMGSGKAQARLQHHGFEIMLLSRRVDFKMPNAGWGGAGAQFPTFWLCWNLLPEPIMFGDITLEAKKAFHSDKSPSNKAVA